MRLLCIGRSETTLKNKIAQIAPNIPGIRKVLPYVAHWKKQRGRLFETDSIQGKQSFLILVMLYKQV